MNGVVRRKPDASWMSRASMRGTAVLWIAAAFLCSCNGPSGYDGITGYDDGNVPTSVTDPRDWIPDDVIQAAHVYPNPAQHIAKLVFELSDIADITIEVYSNPYTRVCVLMDDRALLAGVYSITWDCRDSHGYALAGGIYRVYIKALVANGRSYQTFGDVELDN